jgi:hypothetical protein
MFERQARPFDLLELGIILRIAEVVDILAYTEIAPRPLRRDLLASGCGLLLRRRREALDGDRAFGAN